jgi:hypothetical protein
MTIDEVARIYERQLGKPFPTEGMFSVMIANDLYQFAHAVVREHLAKQLEKAYGSTNT